MLKKLQKINKTIMYCVLMLAFSLSAFSQDNAPAPQDTPDGFTQRGPAPPPPVPIDEMLLILFVVGIALAFYLIHKKKSLDV